MSAKPCVFYGLTVSPGSIPGLDRLRVPRRVARVVGGGVGPWYRREPGGQGGTWTGGGVWPRLDRYLGNMDWVGMGR